MDMHSKQLLIACGNDVEQNQYSIWSERKLSVTGVGFFRF